MFRRTCTALAVGVALTASVVTVFAHMAVARAVPARGARLAVSPASIQVWFTQEPDPSLSRLALIGPAGAVGLTAFRVNADKSIVASVGDTLADGQYTVRWQSAGDDEHVQTGEYAFTVQRAR